MPLSFIKNTALHRKAPKSTNQQSAYVHSLEGGIYLLEVESHGVSEWVENTQDGRPKRFNCLTEAKKYARNLGVQHIRIALDTPYDEMIGLASQS